MNDWCSANLGGLPHIMIGIDEMNPPDRDKYELIALTDIETSGKGMGSGKVTYTIPISCGVMCDEIGISDLIVLIKASGSEVVIPPKSNRLDQRDYDRHIYKERHLVECFFAKIKSFRRIATRYDKLASIFLTFVNIAACIVWLQ